MCPAEYSLAARIGPPSPSHDVRKPLFRNRTWKRDPNEATKVPSGSLVDRLEPDTHSLLRRVGAAQPESPKPHSVKPSLAERLASPGVDDGGTHLGVEQPVLEISIAERPSRSQADLADKFIASVIEQGKQAMPAGQARFAEEPRSPASEAAVDDLLASVRDADSDEEPSFASSGVAEKRSAGASQRYADSDKSSDTGLDKSPGSVDQTSTGRDALHADAGDVVVNHSSGEMTGSNGKIVVSNASDKTPNRSICDISSGGAAQEQQSDAAAMAIDQKPVELDSKSSRSPSSPLDASMLEEAKQLLIPIITQNARLREPDADIETIKAKVLSLITDEQCLEFMKLAKEAKNQIREKEELKTATVQLEEGSDAKAGTEAGAKRFREQEQWDAEPQRVRKMPRLEESDKAEGDFTHNAIHTDVSKKEPSPTLKRIPRAPRAMLAHPERYEGVEEFLRAVEMRDLRVPFSDVDELPSSTHPRAVESPAPRVTRSPTPRALPLSKSSRTVQSPMSPKLQETGTQRPEPETDAPAGAPQSETNVAFKPSSPMTVSTSMPSLMEVVQETAALPTPSPPAQSTAQLKLQVSISSGESPMAVEKIHDWSAEAVAPEREPLETISTDSVSVPQSTPYTELESPAENTISEPTKDDEDFVMSQEGATTQANGAEVVSEISYEPPDEEMPLLEQTSNRDENIAKSTLPPENPHEIHDPKSAPPRQEVEQTSIQLPVPVPETAQPPVRVQPLDNTPLPDGTPLTGEALPHSARLLGKARSPDIVQRPGSSPIPDNAQLIESDSQHQLSVAPSSPLPAEPPQSPIPGLWLVAMGRDAPEAYDIVLEVSEESAAAARRWSDRHKVFDMGASYACVHLLCLPVSAVSEMNQELDPAAPPGDVVSSLRSIPTKWPPQGKLIIKLNVNTSTPGIWLPSHLGPKSGPIDVTPYIHPGPNTIQIIQLNDFSDCIFVLCASVPTAECISRSTREVSRWGTFLHRTPRL